jgi:hypothetical protein
VPYQMTPTNKLNFFWDEGLNCQDPCTRQRGDAGRRPRATRGPARYTRCELKPGVVDETRSPPRFLLEAGVNVNTQLYRFLLSPRYVAGHKRTIARSGGRARRSGWMTSHGASIRRPATPRPSPSAAAANKWARRRGVNRAILNNIRTTRVPDEYVRRGRHPHQVWLRRAGNFPPVQNTIPSNEFAA